MSFSVTPALQVRRTLGPAERQRGEQKCEPARGRASRRIADATFARALDETHALQLLRW